MAKVLVATVKPFAQAAVDSIKEVCKDAGYEFVLLEKYADQSDFVKAVADVDALIIRSDKATKEVIDAAKNLKIIVRAGAGYDNIDLEAATAKNIVVMNTPGQNSNAVAELALGMLVFMARNKFNGTAGTELKDKKIGIHAFGHVGSLVGDIAKGFGMYVYAFVRFVSN
jgi:D-3-phosphoglycerate dehydrogenase